MTTGETVAQPTNADYRLQYLLKNITRKINLATACVCTQDLDTHAVEILALVGQEDEPRAVLQKWLRDQLHNIRSSPSSRLSSYAVDDPPGSTRALIFPFYMPSETTAGLFLFFGEAVLPSREEQDEIAIIADLMRTVIENDYLVMRLVTTEAVAATTQEIAHDPHPQRIVETLRDYLLEAHVTLCVMALYGPAESSDSSPEYLEIRGDWSHEHGSRKVTGRRFPVEEETDDLKGEFTFIDAAYPHDDFSRLLAESAHPRSIVLIPLRSARRKLGYLAIGTNTAREFHWHELRTYQIVAEFLTVTTISEALRRENDFVIQGRAALLDSVKDGIVMTLPGKDAQVLTTNRVFRQMFRVDEGAVKQITMWQLLAEMRISDDVRRNLLAHWRNLHPQSDEIASGEFVMFDDRSEPRNIQWYTAPVYQDHTNIGRIYAFHDVTAERVGERLRTDLLTRVSHELLTPLTSIHGFSQFILEMTSDELPDLAREYTEIILDNARHLKRVFNELIAFTQANAGEIDLYFSDHHLADVIDNAVARAAPQIGTKTIRVHTAFDDALPVLSMDMDRIGQVIHNLLENAIKHAPEDGTIHIQTRYIDHRDALSHSTPQEITLPCALVSIIDDGEGVPADEAEYVFLPFYRTRASNALKIQGAGLGLAMAARIVQLHRGLIWVEPAAKNRRGGRFFFTLPVNPIL